MVILGRPRERGRIQKEIPFRMAMVLYRAQRIDYDLQDRPVNVPIRRTWLERKRQKDTPVYNFPIKQTWLERSVMPKDIPVYHNGVTTRLEPNPGPPD